MYLLVPIGTEKNEQQAGRFPSFASFFPEICRKLYFIPSLLLKDSHKDNNNYYCYCCQSMKSIWTSPLLILSGAKNQALAIQGVISASKFNQVI